MVEIYVVGKKYTVPNTLTIMESMEYAGYQLKRGCGCRSGFCGACATVYRVKGNKEMKVVLACQSKVEDNMYLTQIPFFPGDKGIYNVDKLEATADSIAKYYPEIYKCSVLLNLFSGKPGLPDPWCCWMPEVAMFWRWFPLPVMT